MYLLSFRCYGTWPHGDPRGSVERHWPLIAVRVLSRHVHAVADVDAMPERAIGAMKAYASIRIRAAGCGEGRTTRWARHGSTVQLRDRRAVRRQSGT
jgi:hypothetical protein